VSGLLPSPALPSVRSNLREVEISERLRLRPLGPTDADAVYALLSDERVVRYMLFPRFDRKRARAFVAKVQSPPRPGERGQVVLAIEELAGSDVIGLCGLVLEPEAEEGEAWYLLQPDRWGRGLATEALGGLMVHGFRTRGVRRMTARCLPENPASSRVLEKLGFKREGHLRQNLRINGEWRDSYLYARLASD